MTLHSGNLLKPVMASACSWAIIILLMVPLSSGAQDASEDDSQDSSEHVEESEESYRRRMELEGGVDQSDVLLERSSGPLKAPQGMDALPYDSQKHLRDELRNVIIEQGEWRPEDINASYPYSPSAAAQKSPELREQEEKAWGELVQEYHEREAAALQSGNGRNMSSSPDSQDNIDGSKPSAGKPAARSSDKRPETDAASSTAAGAGVSQSALEFLKGSSGGQPGSGPAGQTNGQQASKPGSSAGGQNSGQPGTLASAQASGPGGPAATSSSSQGEKANQTSEPAMAANKGPQDEVAESAAESTSEKQLTEAEESQTDEEKKKDSAPASPPPGSLAIAELLALESGNKRKDGEGQPSEYLEITNQKAQTQNPPEKQDQQAHKNNPEQNALERMMQEQGAAGSAASAAESVFQSANAQNSAQNSAQKTSKNDTTQPVPQPGTIAIPELEKLKGVERDPSAKPE